MMDNPSSDNIEGPIGRKDEGSSLIPQGGDHPSDTAPLRIENPVGCGERIISSVAMLEKCRGSLEDTSTHLWGLHIRSSAVTLLIGETSAGKTVFLHNLAYHLANGEEFLGLAPPRPLRVLCVDFESHDQILAEHLSVIGTADGWDFYALDGVEPGPKLMKDLYTAVQIRRYDVIIIDPLMEANPVKDENDNAEASKQMLVFRELARSTNTGVVVVHNSGLRKGRKKKTEKFLGRGATSRVDRADISINFTVEQEIERLLHVAKSRSTNLNEKIRFRFAEDLGYELLESTGPSETIVAEIEAEVITVAKQERNEGRTEIERKTFMKKLGIEKGSAKEQALDRALRCLFLNKKLLKPYKGIYALPDVEIKASPEAA